MLDGQHGEQKASVGDDYYVEQEQQQRLCLLKRSVPCYKTFGSKTNEHHRHGTEEHSPECCSRNAHVYDGHLDHNGRYGETQDGGEAANDATRFVGVVFLFADGDNDDTAKQNHGSHIFLNAEHFT